MITNLNRTENEVKHFHDLLETWKQLLNSRLEENILMKNKIAEILKNNYYKNCLDEIEEFQNQFIIEDELIHLLRTDVKELDKLIDGHVSEGKTEESLESKIRNLGTDVSNSTSRFRILQSAFNNFQNKIFNNLEN